MRTVTSTPTTYLGDYFEWTGSTSTMKQYYDAGGDEGGDENGSCHPQLAFGGPPGIYGHHGQPTGGKVAEVRYKAAPATLRCRGEWRAFGYPEGDTPTSFRFTGQRQESGIGLYLYNSRWYDSSLGRFTQADTIVPQPGNVLAWDPHARLR